MVVSLLIMALAFLVYRLMTYTRTAKQTSAKTFNALDDDRTWVPPHSARGGLYNDSSYDRWM